MSDEEIERLVEEAVQRRMALVEATLDERINKAAARRLFIPRLHGAGAGSAVDFMPYSTCSTQDFLHAEYRRLCALLFSPPVMHRKMWEWIFVIKHLTDSGMTGTGSRGVCFGVGQECLPAFFASQGAMIVATDAPSEIGQGLGWAQTNEYADSIERLRQPHLCPNEAFDQRVSFRQCDMNSIDADLTGFDFAWSSCCFEHLGSLEAGMQFVVNSVERCLRPGGVAVHTTEFNLSSDSSTIETGPTVLYRTQDLLELCNRLRARGHHVMPFRQAPDAHILDFHVDLPPYLNEPHIKLELEGYVTTSVGLVIRRGLSS